MRRNQRIRSRAIISVASLLGIFYLVGTFPDNIRLIALIALVIVFVGQWGSL